MRGQPRIELGIGRVTPRHFLHGARTYLVGQDGSDRRIFPVQPFPERFSVQGLVALPAIDSCGQIRGAGRPAGAVENSSRQVGLQSSADDDHARISNDQPVREKEQRPDHEEVNRGLAQ